MVHQVNQIPFSYHVTRNSLHRPDKIFLKDENRSITFRAFEERTNALARGLQNHGVGPGERVCVIGHNCIEMLEAYFGIMKAEGIVVPINPTLAPQEWAEILTDIEPKIIIVGREYSENLSSISDPSPKRAELFVVNIGGPQDFESLIEGYSPIRIDSNANNDDTAIILMTGGTTGKPKGVMLTHSNLLSAAWTGALHKGLRPSDIALVTAPFSHGAALAGILQFILLGNTLILVNGFDSASILHTIEKEKITQIMFPPAMIIKLVQSADISHYDVSSMRCVIYGTAPMPVQALKDLISKAGWELMGGYGATETIACYITTLSFEDHHLDGSPGNGKTPAFSGD